MTGRKTAVAAALLVCWVFAGGASASRAAQHPSEFPDSLEQDVRYLAHPRLDGRQPKSRGSIRARRYITRRFEAYGLEPWGDAEGFCHPVKFGTNVVGVLPGQDPALADEIVLVSAHYDHLGNGKLGASDNASGVGVLLELARRMTQKPMKNKRTLCLAAFDCEERPVVWGATAFTRRADFDPARIDAVVNLDMLGRRAFDCMDDTLFLGRTHGPPALMEAVHQAADASGLRVLPYHLHLTGPTGDHVPFSALGIPTLFYSTGYFSGYHTREDTVERLDWDLLRGSCEVVYATVRQLACVPACLGEPLAMLASRDDLSTAREVLAAQVGLMQARGGEPEGVDKLREGVTAVEQVLAKESYTSAEASAVLQDALVAAMPQLATFFWGAEVFSRGEYDESYWHARLREILFFQKHQADVMAVYGQLVDIAMGAEPPPAPSDGVTITSRTPFTEQLRLLLNHGPLCVMRMNRQNRKPDLKLTSYPLLDEEVAVIDLEDGQRHLGVLVPVTRVSLWRYDKPLRIPRGDFRFGWEVYTCKGNTDTLIDFCLRRWRRWAEMSGGADAVEERGRVWQRVLREIDASRPSFDTYEESLGYRLKEADCADFDEWEARMLRQRDPATLWIGIRRQTFGFHTEEQMQVWREFLCDRLVPAHIRAEILSVYFVSDLKKGTVCFRECTLRDLTALLDDATPIVPWTGDVGLDLPSSLAMAPLFEEAERHRRESMKKWMEETSETEDVLSLTIGDAARTRLAQIAAASGVEDITAVSGDLTLQGPLAFTTFPTGTLSLGPPPRRGRTVRVRRETPCWRGTRMDFVSSYPF